MLRTVIVAGVLVASPLVKSGLGQEAGGGGASPTDAELREVLQEAVRLAGEIDGDDGPFAFRRGAGRSGTLRKIATAQAKAGDGDAAEATFRDAIEGANKLEDPAAKANALQEIAADQAASGRKEEALGTLRYALQATEAIGQPRADVFDLPEPPPPPPSIGGGPAINDPKINTLGMIAWTQAYAGDAPAAKETFRKAIDAAGAEPVSFRRTSTLAEIAFRQVNAGQGDDAKATFARALDYALSLKNPTRTAKALRPILDAQVRAGLADDALATANDRLDGVLRLYALRLLLGQVQPGRKELPGDFLERVASAASAQTFERPSLRWKMLDEVAEARARTGDAEGAIRAIEEFHTSDRDESWKSDLFLAAARALLDRGDRDGARKAAKGALAAARTFRDRDGAMLYGAAEKVAELLARVGEAEEAVRVAEGIPPASDRAQALARVAKARAEAGDRGFARDVITKALEAADAFPIDEALSGLNPIDFAKDDTLGMIAEAQAEAGDVAAALKTADAAGDDELQGRYSKPEAYYRIAKIRAKTGDVEGALENFRAVADKAFLFERGDATFHQALARDQARSGDPKAVLGWARDLESAEERLSSLRGLAEGISARKEAEHPAGGAPGPEARVPR